MEVVVQQIAAQIIGWAIGAQVGWEKPVSVRNSVLYPLSLLLLVIHSIRPLIISVEQKN